MLVQTSTLRCFIKVCLIIHSRALEEFGYFTYLGDVSYDDQNKTISVFDLSSSMTIPRCALNCLNNLECNAIEVCSTVSGEKCRLSNGGMDTGDAISGSQCQRFQMDDVCESVGYINRKTGVCVYDKDTGCDHISKTTQTSGVYFIVVDGEPKQVYCSFESGVAWTVLQRRIDGSENFYRNWNDYEFGFGSLESEFWIGNGIRKYQCNLEIGNKYIHELTASSHTILRIELEDHAGNTRFAEYSNFTVADASDNYRIQVTGYSGNAGNKYIHELTASSHTILRIELEDHAGNTRFAEYSNFTVADASDNYRIQVTGYSGNAGDSFAGTCDICNNGMEFSTYDNDNDNAGWKCAVWGNGGWWHNACHRTNLNGLYGDDNYGKGVNWEDWKTLDYSLKSSTMKVRKL